MIILEYIVVALVLALALTYLIKAFRPKSKKGGCGCGTTNCKLAKSKHMRSASLPETDWDMASRDEP